MIGVTGSNGFIGTHVLKEFEQNGIEVKPFRRGEESLESFASDCSLIVNCAGVNRSNKESDFDNVNVNFLKELWETGRPILNLSSVHAGVDSPYGRTKKMGEKYANVSLRCPGVYGPGCKPNYNSVVATWIEAAAKNEPIRVFGNRLISLLFVEDLADLIRRISEVFFEVENVFLEKSVFIVRPVSVVTLLDLAFIVKQVCKSNSEIVVEKDKVCFDSTPKEILRVDDIGEVFTERSTPLIEGLWLQYYERTFGGTE